MNARLLFVLALALATGACSCSEPPATRPDDGGEGGSGGAGGGGGNLAPLCGELNEVEGRACSPTSCWIFPEPAPMEVRAGGFDSEGRLWIGGLGSAPLRLDEHGWSTPLEGLPSVGAVLGLGFREGEVWAVYGGRLLRFAGESWEEVDRGPFNFSPTALWVTPRAVWLAGHEVRRNDGTGWESLLVAGFGPFDALWGEGEVVFAAGADGAVFRWQDGSWENLPTGVRRTLRSIWGDSSNDVWFGGDGGTLLRWVEDTFHVYDLRSGASIVSIAGSGPDDVLALGYDASVRKPVLFHFDGRLWRPLPLPDGVEPRALWTSPEGVWMAGRGGGMAVWTGECFRVHPGEPRRVLAIEDDRWAVGERGLVLRLGEDGAEVVDAGVKVDLRAVAVFGNQVWIAGDGATLLRGGDQKFEPVYVPGNRNLLALDRSPHGLWIGADDGSIFLADGRSVVQTPSASVWPIVSIASVGDEAWASTQGGEVLRWDGSQWRYERSAYGRPLLFGTGPADLWLLGRGAGSLLEHYDGESWRIVPQNTSTTIHAIASNGNEVWVAHTPNVLHHFDGHGWTPRYLGWRARALAHDGQDLWVLAERHLIRWRSSRVEEVFASPSTLTALFADGGGVWVGTFDGSIGRLEAGGLVFDEPLVDGPIRAFDGAGGKLWAISADGYLLRRDESAWRAEQVPTQAELRALRAYGGGVLIGTSHGLLQHLDGDWYGRWSPVEEIEHLWVDDEGRAVVTGSDGSVHLFHVEEGLPSSTLRESFIVHALHATPDGRIWFGGEPGEDGGHLYRFDGEGVERIDLGVLASVGGAAPWSSGEALVTVGDSLRIVAPDGTTREVGRVPWSLDSISRRRGGRPALAAGSDGGILRLQTTEPAP